MTYSEYAAAEAVGAEKHEFVAGAVYAMAGGTPEHGALAAAFIGELRRVLGDRPCRVFTSDVRLRVRATDFATYPDVTVVCIKLETDPEDATAVTNPVLLVEVLSDSTEAHDRGEKAAHYRHVPSLREYVFVSQRHRRIEVNRRNPEGRWELFEFGPGMRVELDSVGCTLEVDAIYANPLAAA